MRALVAALVIVTALLVGFVVATLVVCSTYNIPELLKGRPVPRIKTTTAPPHPKADVRLLLTMYGVKERHSMYRDVVQQWLNQTNLHIYAVNSGGVPLGVVHDRFSEFVFAQEEPRKTTTYHESDAILRALDHFQFPPDCIVLKVTAKYFCPDLEPLLSHIDADTGLIVQSRHDRLWRNTELLGMRPAYFTAFLSGCKRRYEEELDMEVHLFQFITFRHCHDVYEAPPLNVSGTYRRTQGDVLNYL